MLLLLLVMMSGLLRKLLGPAQQAVLHWLTT